MERRPPALESGVAAPLCRRSPKARRRRSGTHNRSMHSVPTEPPPLAAPPRKLRPWFWFVLLCSPVLTLVANGLVSANISGERELGYLIPLDVVIVPSFILVCSACCAVHLSRVRTGRAHAGWIAAGLFGFFALNLALSFGGCALGATLGESMGK